MATEQKSHWEGVYTAKGEADVSWYQESPSPSLELLRLVEAPHTSAILDVGGGASRLVDALLATGYTDITVLDLATAALDTARKRLGDKARRVEWIVADATNWEPPMVYDVWHDRAAFHFLIEQEERQAYIERLTRGLRLGGHAIFGTFAIDGPEKCSGLPVTRYDAESLQALLGSSFALVDTRRHEHATPWGAIQRFQFSTFRRR